MDVAVGVVVVVVGVFVVVGGGVSLLVYLFVGIMVGVVVCVLVVVTVVVVVSLSLFPCMFLRIGRVRVSRCFREGASAQVCGLRARCGLVEKKRPVDEQWRGGRSGPEEKAL